MQDYHGRGEVVDWRGNKMDDVLVRVQDRGRHMASKGSMTVETMIGWRRFHLAGATDYLLRLADGREVEISVERVPPNPSGTIAFRCPRGLPQDRDEERKRWRRGLST